MKKLPVFINFRRLRVHVPRNKIKAYLIGLADK